MISTPTLRLAEAAGIVLLGLSSVLAQDSQGRPAPSDGVLVLANGNVLKGAITPSADGYDVAVQKGEIHVSSRDVEFCCQTLEEAYRQKRAILEPGDVRARLDLALWCQRHGMLAPAARELAEAKRLVPDHPMIPLVERRISLSLIQPPDAQGTGETAERPPSTEELDRMVRELPPGSIETFTRSIQPLLLNRCATAGCHGPRSESRFRLFRVPAGRPPTRRLTQRNLHRALEWIDRDAPASSPILTAPIRPHGTAEAAVFADHEGFQYHQFVQWVAELAKKQAPADAAADDQPPPPWQGEVPWAEKPPWLAMPAVHTAAPESPDAAPSHSGEGPPPDPFPSLGEFAPIPVPRAPGPLGIPPDPSAKRGALIPSFSPADPFDPEIFNRRFFAPNPAKNQDLEP